MFRIVVLCMLKFILPILYILSDRVGSCFCGPIREHR